MRVDATTAECRILTYKEGLLSAVAHDLELRVTTFTIGIDETTWRVDARFDPTSLRVVGAVRNGVVDPDTLSESDRRTIEDTIVRDVLDAARHPEILFVSEAATGRGDVLAVHGRLDLHGHTGDLTATARREGPAWVADARLHQPDFGIRPYSAMLGTLRVRADVAVRITIPLPMEG